MKVRFYRLFFLVLTTSTSLFASKVNAQYSQPVYIPQDPNANLQGMMALSLCKVYIQQAQYVSVESPLQTVALSCQTIQNNYQLCLVQGALSLDPMYPIKCSEEQAGYLPQLEQYKQFVPQ